MRDRYNVYNNLLYRINPLAEKHLYASATLSPYPRFGPLGTIVKSIQTELLGPDEKKKQTKTIDELAKRGRSMRAPSAYH